MSMQHPTQANYLSTSFVAEAERARTQEGVKSKNNTKRQQKAASETAMQGSKRIPNTAQGKTVTMQHPTQANYLSTSFVAEVERAKTQEGVKSRAVSEISTLRVTHLISKVKFLMWAQQLIVVSTKNSKYW